ncbi:unnamed protein product [Effrenium voratum]|nr:unnamed protein product [Effrenium voratum]
MIRVLLLRLALASGCPGHPPYVQGPVEALCAENFPDARRPGRARWLVHFYGPKCRSCRDLAQMLQEVSSSDLKLGAVDCRQPQNQELCRSLKVWKLPVLMALPGTRYSGPLESEALTQWIRDISDISRLEVLPPASEQMSLCPAFELYEEPRVAREFLAAHNIYRCTAGIAMLEWDLPLFHSARRYADRAPLDRLAHSDPRERKGKHGVYGENVAIGEHLWPGQVVARWHDEIRNTQDGVFRPKRAGLGHYTQLVWRKTLRLGCSLGQNRRVAVCHYDPAGNEKGRHLSQVAPPLPNYAGIEGEERCGGLVEEIGRP